MIKKSESPVAKLAKEEQQQLNREYWKTLGPEGISTKIMDDLVRHFEPKTLVKKGPDGFVDANATMVNCGAYEFMSYIKQRIKLGEQNK